jgi:hypothetical protein
MKKYFIYIVVFLIFILFNLSGCIDDTTNDSVKLSIVTLNVEPSIINKDEMVILSWEVLNAESVLINNGIGSVEIKGSRTLYPHESTSYQLNAMNDTTILISRVELTVIENISDSNDFERDINISPSMTITKDESFNNLKIVSIENGVEWKYINITATDGSKYYYYSNSNKYVKQGDTIYFDGNGLSGLITVRIWYKPINKLISEHTLNGVIK